MTAYFDRKSAGRLRKKRHQKGRIKSILFLIVLSMIGAAAYYGYHMALKKGVFNIKQVTVSGNRMVGSEGLMAIAEPLRGRTIWQARCREISNKIRREYPAVKKAGITIWPWGMADIKITERKPLARLYHDNRQMIDAEGVIFVSSQPDEGKPGLPLLKVNNADAVSIWRGLRLVESAPWVENDWLIDPSDQNDIRLVLPGGAVVHFGNGSFKQEWQKLGEVLEKMKSENLTAAEIDLRFNGQAIVKGQAMVQATGSEGK